MCAYREDHQLDLTGDERCDDAKDRTKLGERKTQKPPFKARLNQLIDLFFTDSHFGV